MPKISFDLPDDLLAAFKAASIRANRTVAGQLRALVSDFIEASKRAEPKPARETAAEKKARVDAINKAHFMDRSAKLLSEGVSPDAIMLSYPSPEWSARERAEMAAWLIEVIESVG